MASLLSLSSLRLLVPPLRLLTAAMWQVARHEMVRHYGMLEDFVSLVTEAVPQLLTDRQRCLLLLALRAKVTLSEPKSAAIHSHLDRIHSEATQLDEDVSECWSALLTLTDKLTKSPDNSQRLLQEVFDQRFDSALQSLISDFLSRIEQLFPVPDFKQAASWFDAAPSGLEDCLQKADKDDLRELLTNQSCLQGQALATVGCDTEETLLSVWSHPLFTKLINPNPSPPETEIQSDVLPEVSSPLQLDVELVKVEVVVITEDEQEEIEETVIGSELEASNESSAAVGNECVVTPVVVEVGRLRDSCGNIVNQSEDTDLSCSEVTANGLHSISHNSQRVAHKCPQCGKCFIYRSQVIRHLRTNRSCGSALTTSVLEQTQPGGADKEPCLPQNRPPPRPVRSLSCFQCNAMFKTKAELLSHQRTHRARPIYHCIQCDKEFHHLSSLTNHRQTHLDKGGFTCSRCNKVFESAKERDAHRLQHRLPDLTCTMCDQTFSSQTRLLRHLQTHSVEGAKLRYNCRFCDQTFSGVTQLRIHQRTHTFRTYQCDLCSKTYGSLTGLQSHRATHTAESRFLCSQCGKRFKTRDGLEGHLRTHTGERPFRCPYCSKDFTALAGLNVHVRRHTGERPYVCTVCGKGWPSGGDLQKHMRTHTGERPYVCQDCGKAFSISCHLTEHRRIHTGEKPFSCPECGKCLRRKFDLKKHMLSHSNIRPYACTFCTKSYTRKTHLNRHLLTHRTADSEVVAVQVVEEP
ncbi:endothelial zinc finger protein induced by tumor necrosis factor alpha-like isoform X1 [Neolamprologus brichardi]|uniref:endothelial zinc finger protein induced by tumor necrosis factor alpha-like isoform X1 n=1 Tax=Neolamprologus brichardi TaxID=32507 RepID=UPI0003EBD769|nr:endothelial zinc finger protein induced by tumor necrosis factor alpha-like isoform X1 [Neolamprologus brichardi]